MKKFLLTLFLAVGLIGLNQTEVEAAHVSFSIGGVMPPLIVMDGFTTGYYPYYPHYYSSPFYFSTCRHRHIKHSPHYFRGGHPPMPRGHHHGPRPHGGHGGPKH